MELEGEIKRFIQMWITVIASLTYCYFISKNISKGKIRLICFLPIISIFTILPLYLSSVLLIGPASFFISWLGNFKLLLFAFDKGPLSSNPSLSLPCFISIACLPIRIKQNPPSKTKTKQNPPLEIKIKQNPCPQIITSSSQNPSFNYAVKGFLMVLLSSLYGYKQHLHKFFILVLYCLYIYFGLEVLLTTVAAMGRSLTGLELEPQSNSPYLSTSLQDFWGKRWNLVVSSILRDTIYEPVRPIYTRVIGKRLALSFAVVTTFAVSGLMHELIFYQFGRLWPTWKLLGSFIFHGVCLAIEIEVKKKVNGRWRLHRLISGPLTLTFVVIAGFSMLPHFRRTGWDVRAKGECAVIWEFLKGVLATSGGRETLFLRAIQTGLK